MDPNVFDFLFGAIGTAATVGTLGVVTVGRVGFRVAKRLRFNS